MISAYITVVAADQAALTKALSRAVKAVEAGESYKLDNDRGWSYTVSQHRGHKSVAEAPAEQ